METELKPPLAGSEEWMSSSNVAINAGAGHQVHAESTEMETLDLSSRTSSHMEITLNKLDSVDTVENLPVKPSTHSQKDTTYKSWAELFRTFTEETSLQGLKFIFDRRSRYKLRNILWGLITAATAIFFVYYLVERITDYQMFKKNVDVGINYPDKVRFPAVTICNQNAFKLTSAVAGGYFEDAKKISDSQQTDDTVTCKEESEIRCDNKCIDQSRMCDGLADCLDGTDENTCGCLRFTVTSDEDISDKKGFDPFFIDQVYERDLSMRLDQKIMYFTSDMKNQETTYLIFDNDTSKWMFTAMPTAKTSSALLYSSVTSSDKPDQSSGKWFYSGGDINLKLSCTSPVVMRQNLTSLVTSAEDIVSLSTMYDKSGYTLNDTILKCTWKGQDCLNAIETEYTDMGRCFTFKPDNFMIEHSGPGSGLGLTVNIQSYEYIKNSRDGVGLKVLLHDSGTPPMMADAFALSPGLFTLVSMDRTEIANLAEPHGKCHDKRLRYYSDYSINTCSLECLNKEIRQLCKCKDIYMPKLQSEDIQNCSVSKYIECWMPRLDKLHESSSICPCSTPCEEIVYVPSLSFSSLSFDSDRAQGVELQELKNLKENLAKAREVAFRVHEEKFTESNIVMTGVMMQSLRSQARFQTVEQAIDSEVKQLHDTLGSVRADCVWLSKQYHQLIHAMEGKVVDDIDKFYDSVYQSLFSAFSQLPTRLEAIATCYNDTTCAVEDCSVKHYYVNGTTTGCNETCTYRKSRPRLSCTKDGPKTLEVQARPLTEQIKHSLQELQLAEGNILASIEEQFINSTGVGLILSPDHFAPLFPYMVSLCEWCFSNTSSLMELLYQKLNTSIVEDISKTLQNINRSTEELNSDYIYNATFLNDTMDRAPMDDAIGEIMETIKGLYSSIHVNLKMPVREAVALISELMHLMNPRCDSELKGLYTSYIYKHNWLKSVLINTKQQFTDYGKKYKEYFEEYTRNNLTLVELHAKSEFGLMKDYIQGADAALKNRFLEREIALYSIQKHLNKLYYWFSAQIPDEIMAETSRLWKRFSISSSILDPGEQIEAGDVPIDETYAFNNTDIDGFWSEIKNVLKEARRNADKGLTDMSQKLEEANRYFTNFISGNEITGEFYRKNFLQMDVYYKELAERTVIQQKAYELGALFSEIGGLLGLLLGASLITLFEFMDFVLYNGCMKLGERRKRKKRNLRVGDSTDGKVGLRVREYEARTRID